MHDFHGWQATTLWEDVQFDLKYFNDIERLAAGTILYVAIGMPPFGNVIENGCSLRRRVLTRICEGANITLNRL